MSFIRFKNFVPLLCASLSLFGANFSYGSSVPSSADPSRELAPTKSKTPDFQTVAPDNQPRQTSVVNAPEGSEKAFFTLKTLNIEGMTAYSATSIQEIYVADIGQRISVRRLFEIMSLIQKKYLDDGYSLSRITMPDQDIANGIVTFKVIEGYAAEVELDGDFGSSPVLDDAVQQISAMRPLNTKKLEHLLLILNDLPGLKVSAVLAGLKGPPVDGGIRLILKENPKKSFSVVIGANNHGSRFSGPTQLVTSVKQAGLITPYDEIAATFSAAIPMTEMRYAGLKYQKPVWGAHGIKLGLEASLGRTVPGANLKSLDVKGQSQSLKASLTYSFIKQRDRALDMVTSFEARNAKTDFSGSELYDDRLRVFSLGATYNNADEYQGLNAIELTYNQGMNILGVREAGSANLSRSEGNPVFHKIYASLGRLQTLPYRFEFLGLLQGQYAFDPLLASEEFGFGGGQLGRGYDPSEITGDKGIAGSIELRRNLDISNANFVYQAYGFFDIGQVWNIDPSAKSKISAASSGIGLRIGTSSGWSGDINLAVPLTKTADNPPKYANGKSPRILVSAQKSF